MVVLMIVGVRVRWCACVLSSITAFKSRSYLSNLYAAPLVKFGFRMFGFRMNVLQLRTKKIAYEKK